MWPNPHETAELVTFNEEIVNGKLEKIILFKQCIKTGCFAQLLTSN